MHLSTHVWMRVEPLSRSLERAAGLGYESVELTGEPDAHPIPETAKPARRSPRLASSTGEALANHDHLLLD